MSCRLILVCNGATPATRKARFPDDEALDPLSLRRASWLRLGRADVAWTAPACRAVQTASALGLNAAVEPLLHDADMGAWTGLTLADIAARDPSGLERWTTDPAAAPPGGECVHDVRDRVGAWLDGLPSTGRVVAVTHAAVVRAAILLALDAPASSFWRIDVAPLCRVTLQGRPGRWTLVSIQPCPKNGG